MRTTVTVAGCLALVLGAGAFVAAFTGAVDLAVAATAGLVLVVGASGALLLLRLHRGHRAVDRTARSVQETLGGLTRAVGWQEKLLSRAVGRLDVLTTEARRTAGEVHRTGLRAQEQLQVHELHITARFDEHTAVQQEQLTSGLAQAAADAAAAAQLVTRYRPAVPIAPSGPTPGRFLPLLLAAVDAGPRSLLTVDLGEQVLWLAYAFPAADIVALVPQGQEQPLRTAAARHGLTDQLRVLPRQRRHPPLAHYYDDWYDPGGLAGPFDLLVLGQGTPAVFPAVPLLLPLLTADSVVLLPADEGSPVPAWQEEGLVEIDEALSAPPVVALRPAPGRRSAG